jgi:hypothetical protein
LNIGCFQTGFEGRDFSQVTHIFFEPFKFDSEHQFTPNEEVNYLGQSCFLTGATSQCYIELPPSITSVTDHDSHWANNSNITLVLMDSMTKIPARMFRKFPGNVKMRDNIVNNTSSDTISLPFVTYIGKDAFTGTASFQGLNLELGNNIEFGGALDTNTSNDDYSFNEVSLTQGNNSKPNLAYSASVSE